MAHDPSDPDRRPGHSRSSARQTPSEPPARSVNAPAWNWLLVIPLIGTLVPAFYDKRTPKLGDIPFFYWYQMAWIAVSVLVTMVVYRATRGQR